MKVRTASLFLLALVPALMMAGCSDDPVTSVVPDTTPPLAPVVEGTSGSGNAVAVWWANNTEADLYGYNIYRIENGQANKVNAVALHVNYATLPVDEGTVRLYVTAVDLNGNESGPSSTQRISVESVDQDRIDFDGSVDKDSSF